MSRENGSEMLLVAVPSGPIAGNTATLRVVFVPRLITRGEADTLTAFPDILSWLDQATRAAFDIEVDGEPWRAGLRADLGGDVGGDDAGVGSTILDMNAWRTFFPPQMPVESWRHEDYSSTPTDIYDTATSASNLVRTYGDCADAGGGVSATQNALGEVHDKINEDRWPKRLRTEVRDGGDAVQESCLPIEFHRAVALLREHPRVLATLGLVVSVRLDATALPAGPGVIRARWAGPEIDLTFRSPTTRYQVSGGQFLPAIADDTRRPGGVEDGFADLHDTDLIDRQPDNPPWAIATFDVDAAADSLAEAAESAGRRAERTTERTSRRAAISSGLPTLRSAGLMLVRADRGTDIATRNLVAAGNAAQESMDEVTLDADDLVLGYRIDVWTQSAGWVSLCRRRAEYLLSDGDQSRTLLPWDDEEAPLKANALALQDTTDGPTLRGDGVVARWSGWSLALPSPFESPPTRREDCEPPLPLNWEYDRVDDPLPALRFGAEYRLRVRIADLAGGGRLPSDTTEGFATKKVIYRRFEPIPPPQVRLPDGSVPSIESATPAGGRRGSREQRILGPGGALHRLVIRSAGGLGQHTTTAEFTAQHDGSGVHPPYPLNDRRLIRRPESTLALLEQHRVLDDDDLAEHCFQLAHAAARAESANGQGPPYGVPDPAAERLAMHVRNGQNSTLLWRQDIYPEIEDKLFELHEWDNSIGNALTSTADAGQVHVYLRPAERVLIELSSCPDPAGSVQAADFALTSDAFTRSTKLAGLDDVSNGRHPMVTPPVEIEVVHAVQKPLDAPSGVVDPHRTDEGQTTAVFRPDLHVHAPSTGSLRVDATWDDLDGFTGATKTRAEVVHTLPVNLGDPGDSGSPGGVALPPQLRQEFGDTKHRRVTYSLTAASRFRQFFFDTDEAVYEVPAADVETVHISSSARPAPPAVRSVVPAFRWETSSDDDGLTRVRHGRRLRMELSTPWYTSGEGEQLAVLVSSGTGEPDRSLREYLSELARDPIWPTSPPRRWPSESLLAAVGSVDVTSADERRGPGARGGLFLRVAPDSHAATAAAVLHDAWFDDGRCYADIEFRPDALAGSYCPFVRLGVARYQRQSLPGLELSSVVRTDAVPLMPDRTLSMWSRSGGRVVVRLAGIVPDRPAHNRVEVHVERCDPPAGVDPESIEWTALGSPPDGLAAWIRLPDHQVTGDLNSDLIVELPSGVEHLRLYVREVEEIELDPASATPDGVAGELAVRTVFVDVVPLPLHS